MSKPKFCPSCGISLGGVAASPKVAPQRLPRNAPRSAPPQNTITDDPDGTDVNYVPHIAKLEYEVDRNYSSVAANRIPLANILGTEPAAQPEAAPVKTETATSSTPPPATKKPNTQAQFDVVKNTIEECKSSAANVVDVGDE